MSIAVLVFRDIRPAYAQPVVGLQSRSGSAVGMRLFVARPMASGAGRGTVGEAFYMATWTGVEGQYRRQPTAMLQASAVVCGSTPEV
jgi:hypothetical protein